MKFLFSFLFFLFLVASLFASESKFSSGESYIFKGDGTEIYFSDYPKSENTLSGHIFYDGKVIEFDNGNLDGKKFEFSDRFGKNSQNLSLKISGENLNANLNGKNLNLKLYKKYGLMKILSETKNLSYAYEHLNLQNRDEKIVKEYLNKAYETTYKEMKKENTADAPSLEYVTEYSIGEGIFYENGDILVLEDTSYIFTGGAHGFGVTTYKNLINGRDLLLVNLLKNVHDEALKAKIWEQIKEIAFPGAKDDLKISNTFKISPYGIIFKYEAYEVAPYSEGEPEAFFTFKEIKPFLSDETIKALGI